MIKKKVDLCIIGAAAGGLCAAVVAKRNGIDNIVVLEKMHAPGGTAVMSAGIMAYGSSTQRKQGLYYDVDQAFLDIITMQNWNLDSKLLRKWILGSGESIDFIESLGHGCHYEVACTETADPSKVRCSRHIMAEMKDGKLEFKRSGLTMMNALKAVCADEGIEIICDCSAKELIQDDEGRIVGVKAEMKDGEKLEVESIATVVATGSCSENKPMIRELFGVDQYAADDFLISASFPWNTGDGQQMVWDVGGAHGKGAAFFMSPHTHFTGLSEIVCLLMRRGHGMAVNRLGERFTDESIWEENEWQWLRGTSQDYQPGRVSYTIFDQNLVDIFVEGKEYQFDKLMPSMLDHPLFRGNGYWGENYDENNWRAFIPDHLKHHAELGMVGICNTVEEMADYIGCEVETLQENIDTYNLYCAKRHDHDFLKNPNYLYPILKPPFYVMRGEPGIDTPIGGVKIDHRQRVICDDGNYIPGLYAAGVCCSGWTNGQYIVNCSAMSFSVYSGRSAGEEAAKYIKRGVFPARRHTTSVTNLDPSWDGGWK